MDWLGPTVLTLQLMAGSVAIAAIVGIVGAWAGWTLDNGNRWNNAIAKFFLASMIAALAMPMILHAAAWESTAGKFGWWVMTQAGARTGSDGVYGFFSGMIASTWIHGMVGAAMVCLATWHGVARVPADLIAQARMELSPVVIWWRVRLPIASPWWVTALVGTAGLAATEMTVVDLYGFRTIADEFYLLYAIAPTPWSILYTLLFPLSIVTTLLLWILVWRHRLPTTGQSVADKQVLVDPESTGARSIVARILATIVAMTVIAMVVAVPVCGLIAKAGSEVSIEENVVQTTWSLPVFAERMLAAPGTFASENKWTAILAAVTGILALVIAWPIAAIGRTHRSAERATDWIFILMVCIPGSIVGLAVVTLFQSRVPGFRTIYQSTLVPTVIALLPRAVPVAYWILRSGYRGIASPVLDSAAMEVSSVRRFLTIDRIILKRHLVVAWLAAAVVASGDVPATLPVIPAGVTTVSVRLFGLLHSGARYQEASLAIWYVAVVVIIALIGHRMLKYDR